MRREMGVWNVEGALVLTATLDEAWYFLQEARDVLGRRWLNSFRSFIKADGHSMEEACGVGIDDQTCDHILGISSGCFVQSSQNIYTI